MKCKVCHKLEGVSARSGIEVAARGQFVCVFIILYLCPKYETLRFRFSHILFYTIYGIGLNELYTYKYMCVCI